MRLPSGGRQVSSRILRCIQHPSRRSIAVAKAREAHPTIDQQIAPVIRPHGGKKFISFTVNAQL